MVAAVMGAPANGAGRPAAGTAARLATQSPAAVPQSADSVPVNGTQPTATVPAAPDPSLQLAITTTQKLAVVATAISLVAVLVAVFKRGR
jgi:hypothetical protein